MKQFKKILIANRGEIAVRIIRTARKMAIKTVAIYSEADADALHVSMADESFSLGNGELADTYLNIQKIVHIAQKADVQAIHPGYGFLSERSEFAQAVVNAGLVFIGPSPKAIQQMGNKIAARSVAKSLGVPLVEGISGSLDHILAHTHTLQFPVLVKAAAGGGGKGMRIVRQENELAEALQAAAREAKAYFGSEEVYVERFIETPRHIEIQLLADNFGNCVYLFERECTIQRRYQKIIEEAPSPTLNPKLRKAMGDAAVRIANEIGYSNAGTIEFLVDENLNFYFLEMNTRIQVEHPVTELTTGVDIVREQLLIAAGNRLMLSQEELQQKGHAIECRIYAEDPSNQFLPSPGKMTHYSEPTDDFIRLDSGLNKATEIKSFFDPMIAKLIVTGTDREQAIHRMGAALRQYHIHGIKTNIPYLKALIDNQLYKQNQISTKFCDTYTTDLVEQIKRAENQVPAFVPLTAYLLFTLNHKNNANAQGIWNYIGFWRQVMLMKFKLQNKEHEVYIQKYSPSMIELEMDKFLFSVHLNVLNGARVEFTIDEKYYATVVSEDTKGNIYVSYKDATIHFHRTDRLYDDWTVNDVTTGGNDVSRITSPMPGKVVKIKVQAGDSVKKGSPLIVVEAMKMENVILAPANLLIKAVNTAVNERVDVSKNLFDFEILTD